MATTVAMNEINYNREKLSKWTYNWMNHNRQQWINPYVWFDMVQPGSISDKY